MKNILEKPNKWAILTILAISSFLIFNWFNSIAGADKLKQENIYRGEVLEVLEEKTVPALAGSRTSTEQDLKVLLKLSDGEREVEVLNDFIPVKSGAEIYAKGSGVGSNDEAFFIVDVIRTNALAWLVIVFIAITLLVSGWKGFYALVGLLFSFAVIFSFVIPQILQGANPVFIGLIGSFLILIVAIYVSHGFNPKSLSALLGISLTLIIVGLTANFFTQALHFTGYSGEESLYLNMESDVALNLVGLVTAGIIIAAIGILDDIAVTQASIVQRLRKNNPELAKRELFRHSMEVGRDHIAAVINTLVLAYVGAALPLLLLLSLQDFPLGFTVNGEIIAEEIARTLVASTGLILAVPITTAIAVLSVTRKT